MRRRYAQNNDWFNDFLDVLDRDKPISGLILDRDISYSDEEFGVEVVFKLSPYEGDSVYDLLNTLYDVVEWCEKIPEKYGKQYGIMWAEDVENSISLTPYRTYFKITCYLEKINE